MITFKCPQCGTQLTLDENVSFSVICQQCGYTATLEKDAPAELEKLRQKEADFEAELDAVCQKYGETGDVKEVHAKVENFGLFAGCTYLYDEWKTFILNVTGVAEEKKDVELQTYLKNHAKDFDATVGQKGGGLFSAVLQAYPKAGTNNDWDDLIKQTCGDNAKFAVLCDNIINYIVKTRDKAFAMDIFNLLSAQEEEWAEAGRIYLRALLSSDEVASSVFPKSAFNGRTKKFIKKLSVYCKKYLSGGNELTLEETKVWSNYLAARKSQKRRNIIIILAAIVIAAGTAGGVFAYMDAPDKDTVKINVDKVIEVIYGEKPDLSEYSIVYDKNSGEHVEKEVTLKMLKGYDPEKLGEQSGITISFAGVKETVTVIVKNAQLDAPVLKQSGNYVSWDIVPNSETYSLYVNRTLVSEKMTTTTYDLSKLSLFGELSVTARAETASTKFDASADSEPLIVNKLKNPDGLKYLNGVLSWNPVDGAAKYELVVNSGSAIPVDASATSYKVPLNQGANSVKITVKGDINDVDGVTSTEINYVKLAEISSLTYSQGKVEWAAVGASSYDVYVDGELWRGFNKKSFEENTDKGEDNKTFIERFGAGLHELGIVCKSSISGTESSEKTLKKVAFGNTVSVSDGVLSWDSVGTGASYTASCGEGEPLELQNNNLSIEVLINENKIKEGDNVLTLGAKLGADDIILETVTLKKHAKPAVSVNGDAWTGTADGLVYTFDGAPVSQLPAVSEITAGEHTLTAQRLKSSATAFEIDSEVQSVSVYKPYKPALKLVGGELNITNYDESKFGIKLSVTGENGFICSSLDDIKLAGEYDVCAVVTAKGKEGADYDLVLDSDKSDALHVTKLAPPTVSYNNGDTAVTASVANAKFYYKDANGNEQELAGGLISNLPAGMFEIYARAVPSPTEENTLASEPSANKAQVFNLNIALTVTKISGQDRMIRVRFDNCQEVEKVTYTYEIKYFNSEGKQIGTLVRETPVDANKLSASSENAVSEINYRLNVDYESKNDGGKYNFSDVKKIQFIAYLQNSNGQILSAEMRV